MPQTGNISPEFVRAWQLYFRQRGGEGPNLPGDVLPVVIMDDASLAPYAACQPWMAGDFINAAPTFYSYLGIMNTDPVLGGQNRSAAVIDEIQVRTGDTSIVISILLPGSLVLTDVGTVEQRNIEPQPTPADRPRIGNIKLQSSGALNTALGGVVLGLAANVVTLIKGPWVLGPQTQFVVRSYNLNFTLYVYFRGRHYAAP